MTEENLLTATRWLGMTSAREEASQEFRKYGVSVPAYYFFGPALQRVGLFVPMTI